MTIGLFSPMPPARSGVADYAAALSAALSAHGSVAGNAAGDVNLYQIGNNRIHADDLERSIARPGVVTLHDASLQHLYLSAKSEASYVEEFVFNYGSWFRPLAMELYRVRGGSGLRDEYVRFPMLRRLTASASRVVVHNEAAAAAVEAHGGRPVVIPHLALPMQAEESGAAGEITFAVFGYLRESKRILPVLRAFHRVNAIEAKTRLVLAGSWASDDLPRSASRWLEHPGVRVTGYLKPADFCREAATCDVCLNLRHPSLGETSGVTIRLMSMGKPVVVSAGLENAGFPRGSVLPLDPGPGEEDALFETMVWLARSGTARREIGRMARTHVEREHDPASVAARYWEVLCSLS